MMTFAKIQSILIKMAMPTMTMARAERTICQRSASKWSMKDISSPSAFLLKRFKAIF
jgi:hypothetical protein